MDDVQYIAVEGETRFAVVPIELWNKLRALAHVPEIAGPDEVRVAIDGGVHPLRAWRHYRQLTTQALADLAGVSRVSISYIETGMRTGSVPVLKALALALKVSPAAITRVVDTPSRIKSRSGHQAANHAARYVISNRRSGVELGQYDAEDEQAALDALARDAGYPDYEALCAVAPATRGEIAIVALHASTAAH